MRACRRQLSPADGNLEEVRLLPAAEDRCLSWPPGGLAGLSERLRQLAAKAAQNGLKELAATLEQDREAISQGRSFPAMDRYLPLIYPKAASAAHYLPEMSVWYSPSARVADGPRPGSGSWMRT